MYTTSIWHVAEDRTFPLEVHSKGNFQFTVHEIRPTDLANLQPEKGTYHVFLIEGAPGTAGALKNTLAKARHLNDFPKLVVVPSKEYQDLAADFQLVPRAYLLDDSIRTRNLLLILELLLQQEYYRQVVYGLSGDMRKSTDIFENMIALARKELTDARAETDAYRSLMDYEEARRQFGLALDGALQEVNSLRDRELLGLKEQLAATERLSEFRDRELRQARDTIDAAEAALEFSRTEQMRRENILLAMDRLRSYTETELLELFQENQELRKRLGMAPRHNG